MEDLKKYHEADRCIREQERILRFSTFTSDTDWELGTLMVEEVKRQGIELAIAIRRVNG